jgi:hypothetical protein
LIAAASHAENRFPTRRESALTWRMTILRASPLFGLGGSQAGSVEKVSPCRPARKAAEILEFRGCGLVDSVSLSSPGLSGKERAS